MMKTQLLGGIPPGNFLRDHWQKKPLLIRQALPGFRGLLNAHELIDLACQEDAQSRLITRRNGRWEVRHGPFATRAFARLPKKGWTLLVQDVNHFLPAARELLLKFNFIPHSRLDDLMVSYAPEDGGVGPHFDSYDVFLLQGAGSRRWRISGQKDRTLVAAAPLKILQDFRPEQEWVLEPGDMLYLPPGYAHDGVAVEPCMTYSIGFRAPTYQELATHFLVHLQDGCEMAGMYEDPDLGIQTHPGRISSAMLAQISAALDRIEWDNVEVERFIGMYLTEPKPHVFFTPPPEPISEREFARRMEKGKLQLDLKSRMLFRGNRIFLNGDVYEVGKAAQRILEELADRLDLSPARDIDAEAQALLYQWYLDGYVYVEDIEAG